MNATHCIACHATENTEAIDTGEGIETWCIDGAGCQQRREDIEPEACGEHLSGCGAQAH